MKEMTRHPLNRLASDDVLYFLSYGIFLVVSLLSASFYYRFFIGSPYTWIQAVCIALLVVREYRMGCSKQSWLTMAVLGALCILSLQATAGNLTRQIPLMFFYIYGARNIPFRRIARFSLYAGLTVVALVVFSGYLCLIDNVVVAKGRRVREYLGFRYALYLPGILLNLTALWIYLRKENLRLWDTLLWLALNGFVYYKTDSRISFALAVILLVSAFLMKHLPKLTEKLRWFWGLLTGAFAACGVFSIVFTFIYDGSIPWMRRLNSMLESRLSLGKRSLEDHGFGIFGKQILWVGNGLDAFGNSVEGPYTYVDCLYVKILQRYGILFTVSLLSLLTWAMVRLWKQKHYLLILICASVAAHCILDDLSLSLHYNTFWIAMAMSIINPEALEE